jgi:hypothetical protein
MKTKYKSIIRTACHPFIGAVRAGVVMLIAANAYAQSTPIAGDLQNPFDIIGSLPPDYGWAQQFTIAGGTWNVTAAEVYVGNQYPGLPSVPVVQIRSDAAGNVPGDTLFGTFTMNPNNIPAWEFGVNHLAAVSAPADSSISLGPGTYWLCMMNFAATNSYGAIDVGFADASPMQQSGAAGNLINVASLATWNGQSFSSYTPEIGGQTLLVELDGLPIPEPSAWTLVGPGAFSLLAFRRKSANISSRARQKGCSVDAKGQKNGSRKDN